MLLQLQIKLLYCYNLNWSNSPAKEIKTRLQKVPLNDIIGEMEANKGKIINGTHEIQFLWTR